MIEEACNDLSFPLIVKHYNGYSSINMTKESKVRTPEQLRVQAKKMIDEFGGALIEEFIEGREFTVLAVENPTDPKNPYICTPIECRFSTNVQLVFQGILLLQSDGWKSYDIKWIAAASISWIPCQDATITINLKEMTHKMFLACKGTGYGRADFRMDKNGVPYFLEINPNCGTFYPPGPGNYPSKCTH